MEKKKADLAEALFCSPGERSPAPPISMLGGPPPKFVPERTKVWRNGTCLTGNTNIEIGGRGQRHTPTAPQDMPEFSQHFCSVLFSKFCPPTAAPQECGCPLKVAGMFIRTSLTSVVRQSVHFKCFLTLTYELPAGQPGQPCHPAAALEHSPSLALTYGVRQLRVTAYFLTYRFGPDL